jgi:hypothetical protein
LRVILRLEKVEKAAENKRAIEREKDSDKAYFDTALEILESRSLNVIRGRKSYSEHLLT